MSLRVSFAVVALLAVTAGAAAEAAPRIAIIIDDLGYQLEAGERALRLPGPLSFAILPATPRGTSLARSAHASGREVLLHLPLQAVEHEGPPEPGGITLDMSRDRFRAAFAAALAAVPHAVGVSSHRGSLLTRHPGHMAWLMDEIRNRDGLFFVDSFTTHASVALAIAHENGIAAIRRDVFLDNDRTPAALHREFARLKRLARQRGFAIGIGHPYPETLDFLERELRSVTDEGFELIPVSKVTGIGSGR